MRTRRGVSAVVVAVVAISVATPASATNHDPVTVVASGLAGPFGLQVDGGDLYVAESFAGLVTRIDRHTGAAAPVLTGLMSPSGVARVGDSLAFITAGGEAPDSSRVGDASVFVAPPGGPPALIADIEAYELAVNPDGQQQFGPTGFPLDALSNPFAVLAARGSGYLLVADGGANAVFSVSHNGEIGTFFVPPVVTTGACAGRPNNDDASTGCDSVPTGLAYGPRNTLYVSTLSGDEPGEGRVYALNSRTRAVLHVLSGFDGPTGVAVAPDGTVYVSEVFGASTGGPPGRIVRVAPDGTRTYASVPFPTGLALADGILYASSSLGPSGAVLALRPSAFS